MSDRPDNGCDRSVVNAPVHSSLRTAERASLRSTPAATSTSAILIPDCAASSTLTRVSSLTNCDLRPAKPDIAEQDRVCAAPHLIAPTLVRAQPACPGQQLSDFWFVEQTGGLHVDHQVAAVGQMQEEVGHMAARCRTVGA